MPSRYLAAAVQFEPALGQCEGNLRQMVELVGKAAGRGVALVVFPEMATSGYCWMSRDEVAPHVETIDGPSVAALCRAAREHGVWVAFGFPERDPKTGIFYNSAALVGPNGLVGRYRKTHSYVTEARWARDGDLGLPVFDTPLGRLGILICMDAEYAEPARILALDGCDVVCFPTNWLSEASPSPYWQLRAWENGAYWVASNRYGLERGVQFSGGSAVISPDGLVLDRVDAGPGIAVAEIDLDRARLARAERLRHRCPQAYQALEVNSYLWPVVHNPHHADADALDGLASLPEIEPFRIAAVAEAHTQAESLPALVRESLAVTRARLLVLPPVSGDLRTQIPRIRSACDAASAAVVVCGPWADRGGRTGDAVLLIDGTGVVAAHRGPDPLSGGLAAFHYDAAVVRLGFANIGLLTGAELQLPEPARCLAASGVEVIAVSAALDDPAPSALDGTSVNLPPDCPRGPNPLHFLLPRLRAAENNCWLAFGNAGSLPGGIFGPSHYRFPRCEAFAANGQAAMMDLMADHSDRDRRLSREKPYLRMRRPELYESLVSPANETNYMPLKNP